MGEKVDISIPVEPEAAAALTDLATREAIGRMISRILRPRHGIDALLAAMENLGAEAARRGLTQAILDDELAAFNAERRERGQTGA